MQELRLTVALELNDLDHKILEYTRFVCQSLPITKIYVLHVEERLDLPESMLAKHPELENAPFDETLEQQMKDKVEQFLDTEKLTIDYDVLEGKVIDDRFVLSKVFRNPATGRLGPPLPEAEHRCHVPATLLSRAPRIQEARAQQCGCVFSRPGFFTFNEELAQHPEDAPANAVVWLCPR